VDGAIQKELKELYKLRARLRSQIARLDSQIVALDGGPVANLRRLSSSPGKRPSRVLHYEPSDGRA